MDARSIKGQFLSHVNDAMEVVEAGEGFFAWMPMAYSDDDAVCLAVLPDHGGWRVTDQGSTLNRLRSTGTGTSGERFDAAWEALTRPASGFIPDDREEGVISAWGSDEEVGRLLQLVSQASLRAEGLNWMAASGSRKRFADRVATRLSTAFHNWGVDRRVDFRTNSPLPLRSGRTKRVTATVERDGDPLLAVQALGGGTRDLRERSFERCYATFGPATLPRDRRLAIAIGDADAWDSHLIEELNEFSDVVFFDRPNQVEQALRELLSSAQLLPA